MRLSRSHATPYLVLVILGTGIDLVSVPRLERFRERWGPSGLRRLFTRGEAEYCLALACPGPSFAARFAAKEAFLKALGTGYSDGIGWTEVEVVRHGRSPPSLRLEGRAAELARTRGVRRVHLSLSHTGEMAAASVVLEGEPGASASG